MKKKVLFVLPSFEVGGTTVSMKNLILLLDKNKYEIEVLAMADTGNLQYLYDDVKQISTSFLLRSLTVASWRDHKSKVGQIVCGCIRFVSRISSIKRLLLKLAAKMTIDSQKYDVIAACQEGICTHFVSQIKCENKVAWVRCDYIRYMKECQIDEKKIYAQFKKIVCVSDITKQKFCQVYPSYANKCWAINNPQSGEFIKSQADVDDHESRFVNENIFTIVSIGRYNPIKRFNLIPKIASELISKGLLFRWYIIGGGPKEEELSVSNAIKKEGVEEIVIPLGIKTNPHYYIKNADLLVSLSSSEACPRVINEAKILGTPVICTNFDTAEEYIVNRESGFIGSLDEIGSLIAGVMQDRLKFQYIVNNISSFSFENEDLLKKIDEVLS